MPDRTAHFVKQSTNRSIWAAGGGPRTISGRAASLRTTRYVNSLAPRATVGQDVPQELAGSSCGRPTTPGDSPPAPHESEVPVPHHCTIDQMPSDRPTARHDAPRPVVDDATSTAVDRGMTR